MLGRVLLCARGPAAAPHLCSAGARPCVDHPAGHAVLDDAGGRVEAPARPRARGLDAARTRRLVSPLPPRDAASRERGRVPREVPAVLGGHARRARPPRRRGGRTDEVPSMNQGIALVTRRTIRASAARLFEAWTQPHQLRASCGPSPETCSGAEVALRVCGRYPIANT